MDDVYHQFHSDLDKISEGVVGLDFEGVRESLPLEEVPSNIDYSGDGEPEVYPEIDFRKLVGEDVPETSYATHNIQKHPATFIPQIPRYFIREYGEALSADDLLVLDPFSGTGTTGVEANIAGADYLGVEINPLSKLMGDVATSYVHPEILDRLFEYVNQNLLDMEKRLYREEDVDFPGRTNKEHWFEDEAVQSLTTLRRFIRQFDTSNWVKSNFEVDSKEVSIRVNKLLTLAFTDTVFTLSNADPGVSKAYKSKDMREKINSGDHPPDGIQEFIDNLSELVDKVGEFVSLSSDHNRNPENSKSNIIIGDSRSFNFEPYKGEVDMVVTSPPYINAINYYRGSKLRLFWAADLIEGFSSSDASSLKNSIIGSNSSVSLRGVDKESLPWQISNKWTGKGFERTRLPLLDKKIASILDNDKNDSEKHSMLVYKFFMEDMLHTLQRLYEHLRDGGYVFFVVGENTVGGEFIETHKYIEDIASNLTVFNSWDKGDFDVRVSAFDRITNRDLFQSRNHDGGVIECEWVVVLRKPN